MPNPPTKSAYDLARQIFGLNSEQRYSQAAKLIEAYYLARNAEAERKLRKKKAL